jgi:flagellin
MLAVAEGGLTKIKDLLLDIRDKIEQAANDTMGTEERLAIAQQVREYMHEIYRIAHETRWNDMGILDDTAPPESNQTASTTFYFQTGADSFETTTWERTFKFITNNGTIANTEDNWSNWQSSADKIGIMLTKANDTTQAVAAQVYSSKDGLQTASAQFTVEEVYASLGVKTTAGITAGSLSDSQNVNASANELLQRVDATIRKVSEWTAGIGALMARLQAKEETVMVAQVNVEASWNTIYNADMAKEQVYATRDQILQQTATAMLAQANTAPQSVLQLFRG